MDIEVNKGGYPVKNASYWRRRCVELEAEVERLTKIEGLASQLVFHHTRLSSPDMGGKHRYSFSYKTYEVMEPLRQLLLEGSE